MNSKLFRATLSTVVQFDQSKLDDFLSNTYQVGTLKTWQNEASTIARHKLGTITSCLGRGLSCRGARPSNFIRRIVLDDPWVRPT